jgi:hypothetical protein
VEGKPLFERPKGVIDNAEDKDGKAKAAAPHQVSSLPYDRGLRRNE